MGRVGAGAGGSPVLGGNAQSNFSNVMRYFLKALFLLSKLSAFSRLLKLFIASLIYHGSITSNFIYFHKHFTLGCRRNRRPFSIRSGVLKSRIFTQTGKVSFNSKFQANYS